MILYNISSAPAVTGREVSFVSSRDEFEYGCNTHSKAVVDRMDGKCWTARGLEAHSEADDSSVNDHPVSSSRG
ncbi:hypothetical protein AB6A40_001586 [Gnathostoma spinigerum]|uniref:Uncharacterized protein n=1 Tax=Gnathostoma spinigerum TaxID=75299 RepID=A0ABD6E6K5_9BILA